MARSTFSPGQMLRLCQCVMVRRTEQPKLSLPFRFEDILSTTMFCCLEWLLDKCTWQIQRQTDRSHLKSDGPQLSSKAMKVDSTRRSGGAGWWKSFLTEKWRLDKSPWTNDISLRWWLCNSHGKSDTYLFKTAEVGGIRGIYDVKVATTVSVWAPPRVPLCVGREHIYDHCNNVVGRQNMPAQKYQWNEKKVNK